MRNTAIRVVLLCGIAVALPAATPAPSDIDTLLRTAVEQKRVPMVVAMVADRSGLIYEHATGVPKDAIFAIASMTKPVTSVAVMQLVEQGRVKLDEPASTYVPELGDVRVLDGGTQRPPRTPVTVRHLLTHTSGFGYEFMNRELAELVAKRAIPSAAGGGDGFLKAPLVFDPGTRWEYGISSDWLGKLVERTSGMTLDAYFREKIFRPLRMGDSFFVVPSEKQPRLAPVYQRTSDGTVVAQPRQAQKSDGFFSGGGGLFSTAPDYLRFVRALMAGGTLDGQRILSEASVAMMGKNQIGDLAIRAMPSLIPEFITDGAVLPGSLDKFGLGFALNSSTANTPRGANTMAWAGALNTFFWIDRQKQVGVVFFTQSLPFLDSETKKVVEDVDRAVYAWKAR
jgi:methyl acetate hydrolase